MKRPKRRRFLGGGPVFPQPGGAPGFICKECRSGAHDQCLGGTWCDCHHRQIGSTQTPAEHSTTTGHYDTGRLRTTTLDFSVQHTPTRLPSSSARRASAPYSAPRLVIPHLLSAIPTTLPISHSSPSTSRDRFNSIRRSSAQPASIRLAHSRRHGARLAHPGPPLSGRLVHSCQFPPTPTTTCPISTHSAHHDLSRHYAPTQLLPPLKDVHI